MNQIDEIISFDSLSCPIPRNRHRSPSNDRDDDTPEKAGQECVSEREEQTMTSSHLQRLTNQNQAFD
jgi:hypothetical protein